MRNWIPIPVRPLISPENTRTRRRDTGRFGIRGGSTRVFGIGVSVGLPRTTRVASGR